jgi:hypothetical protein
MKSLIVPELNLNFQNFSHSIYERLNFHSETTLN